MKFASQNAWVSGSSGGIGSAVCKALEAEGAKVFPLGRTLNALNDLPAPDILVCCHAAPVLNKAVVNMLDDEWQRVIDVDLTWTFQLVRSALRRMIPSKYGRIVLFSSILAHHPFPNRTAYAAAKGGVESFCHAVAVEVAGHGVTINCVSPGFTDTERTKGAKSNPVVANIINRIPIKRMIAPQEIVDSVLYLLSTPAVTGTVLEVHGGLGVSIE